MNWRAALAAAAAALATAVPAASAATWTPVTSGSQGNSYVLGLARTADGVLHVAWQVDNPDHTGSINVTPISPSGQVGSPATVVNGWAGVGSPTLLTTPDGGLRIFFPGSRTTTSTETLFGMISGTSDASGTSWGSFVNTDPNDYGYARVAGATLAQDGTPFTAWYDASQTVVHRGLDPAVPAREFTDGTGGACCAILQNLATDASSGAIFAAWCQFDNSPDGVYAQGVDPATGAPGSPVGLMPGSVTTYQGQQIHSCEVTQRQPLAARAGGGVYTTATAGYPSTNKVLVWRIGNQQSTLVALRKSESLKVPQLAATPDGRLWVGWIDSQGRVLVRRSNRAATVWGATVAVKPPKDTVSGYALDLAAQTGPVTAIARFASVATLQAYATQIEPGLSLSATPASLGRGGGKVKLKVTDAGDAVKGATVTIAGKSATTNAKGVATIAVGPFRRKAKLAAKATKKGYVGAADTVRVR